MRDRVQTVTSHVTVSSPWRSLALSDSKSSEIIEVYSPKTLPRAVAYAERSADAAVHVRVDLYDYEIGMMRKLKTLRARRLRNGWAEVDEKRETTEQVDREDEHQTFVTARRLAQALQNIEAPLLHNFRVDVNEAADEDEELAEDAAMSGNERTCFPPLSRLVTLSLHNTSPEWLSFTAFKDIAAGAVYLQHLSLASKSALGYCKHSLWPFHDQQPTVHMPSLRALRLKLSDEYPGLAAKALLSIDAPRLPFVTSRKFPHLEYLTLEFFDMTKTPLFATAFPTIKHLRLSYFLTSFSVRISNDMGVKPDGSFLWPKLETIVLEIQNAGNGSAHMGRLRDAMCRVVNARSGFGPTVMSGLPSLYNTEEEKGVRRGGEQLSPKHSGTSALVVSSRVFMAWASPASVPLTPLAFNIHFFSLEVRIDTRMVKRCGGGYARRCSNTGIEVEAQTGRFGTATSKWDA
ncbi:hypothetical protein NMY22_g11027 [Coprinellus aureogranulatus]|nr:hypothetical protein NMY22_g11027 [Coprinellus aureogranulatus]